jgi:hypothetical protein
VRTLRAFILWWIGLYWAWFPLVGEWNRIEWVAAACMATVGASLGALVAARGLLRFRVPLSALASARSVPAQTVVDFVLIMRVLVRRLAGRDVRGRFVARRFRATGRGATRDGDVAFRTLAAMISPNALPVEADPDEGVSLFHDLIQNRPSEEPA